MPIENDLLHLKKINDLNADQKYLLGLCFAELSENHLLDINLVSDFHLLDLGISLRNPGKLDHSWWLTLTNHTLRLYEATKNLSVKLRLWLSTL